MFLDESAFDVDDGIPSGNFNSNNASTSGRYGMFQFFRVFVIYCGDSCCVFLYLGTQNYATSELSVALDEDMEELTLSPRRPFE